MALKAYNQMLIGNLSFDNIFVQGPLAGVSNTPFRRLIWQHSQPAFCFTEMISSQTVLHRFELVNKRYLNIHPEEGPLCVQLSGNNPQHVAEAVKRVTDAGASLINLNCGCPVKKIRAKKSGSYLLSDAQRLYDLAAALKSSTHLPVSLKIRIDSNSGDTNNATVAQIAEDAGMDFLIVHGRHWREDYTYTPCYEQIEYFVDRLKIPVIGNGDICDKDSLDRMLKTRCSGVMIGRASVGRPWLIKQLKLHLQNQAITQPDKREIIDALIQHVSGLTILFDNDDFALLNARSFIKYYLRNLPNSTNLIQHLTSYTNYEKFITACNHL